MLPLVDFGNHYAGCKHTSLRLEPCKPKAPEKQDRPDVAQPMSARAAKPQAAGESKCVVWRAGEDVPAGQEVCYTYKPVMLQDMALLWYGFLQVGQSRCICVGGPTNLSP